MKILFYADFDGELDIQPGDRLEFQVMRETDDGYKVAIVRQTGVRPSPPDLGVNVSDDAGISDRIG